MPCHPPCSAVRASVGVPVRVTKLRVGNLDAERPQNQPGTVQPYAGILIVARPAFGWVANQINFLFSRARCLRINFQTAMTRGTSRAGACFAKWST